MSEAVTTRQQELAGKYRPYPEYKDSGVEWLQLCPSSWETKALKYIVSCNDEVLSESTDPDMEFEYIDIGGVSSSEGITRTESMRFSGAPSRARRIVRQGDIIVSTVRTYLEAIAPISLEFDGKIASTGFAVLRPKYLLSGFAKYALRARHFIDSVVARSTGVSYPAINSSELIDIKIVVPSLKEQQTIASFLDYETARIDRLIAQQQRLIELLKEKRQAVISHAVTKGLNPNAPMKDSGVEWLGQVPEHWKVGPIKYTLQSKKGACKAGPFGSHLTNADMTGSDVKVITQRNVIDDDMEVGDSYISSDKYKELRAFTIQKGDILVTTRGTIGRTALFQQEYTAILHPCLIRLQADGAILIPEWLSLLIQESGYVVEQILIKSNATTIEVIYSESLLNVDIAYPPSESEQIDVLDFINCQKMKFQHLISAAGRAISLMQERRTALISAAVTGKIDLRGWTPPAEEVAA